MQTLVQSTPLFSQQHHTAAFLNVTLWNKAKPSHVLLSNRFTLCTEYLAWKFSESGNRGSVRQKPWFGRVLAMLYSQRGDLFSPEINFSCSTAMATCLHDQFCWFTQVRSLIWCIYPHPSIFLNASLRFCSLWFCLLLSVRGCWPKYPSTCVHKRHDTVTGDGDTHYYHLWSILPAFDSQQTAVPWTSNEITNGHVCFRYVVSSRVSSFSRSTQVEMPCADGCCIIL